MYQIGKAKVRIHGTVSRERLEVAIEKLIRGVEAEKRKEAYSQSAAADGEVETRSKSVACS